MHEFSTFNDTMMLKIITIVRSRDGFQWCFLWKFIHHMKLKV